MGRVNCRIGLLVCALALAALGCRRQTTIPPEGLRLDLGRASDANEPSRLILSREFNDEKDLTSLRLENVSGPVQVSGGLLRFETERPSPFLVLPFERDASEANLLSVRIRCRPRMSKLAVTQLVWTTPESPMGCEENSMSHLQGASEFFQILHFPMCRSLTWKGRIDLLRLDPSEKPGFYEIDYIRVSKVSYEDLFLILTGNRSVECVTIGDETRLASSCPAPSRAAVTVVPEAGSTLKFALGILPEHWASLTGPVSASIRAKAGLRRETVVFSATLDPMSNVDDRRWIEGQVDLTPFAGRRVILSFMTEPNPAQAWGIWASPRLCGSQKPGRELRPDAILISVDTLRADRLGACGYPGQTSPQIDAMAQNGMIFPNVIAQSSWTLPSHMSLLTSLSVDQHRVYDWKDRLDPDIASAVSAFRDAGYFTAAITDGGVVSKKWGMNRGFDVFWEKDRETETTPVRMRETVDRALDLLRSHSDEPIFLFLHTYEVHDYWNYRTPSEAARKHYSERIEGDPPFSCSHEELLANMQQMPPILNETQHSWLSALYDARIFSVDQEIGRLRQAVDFSGHAFLAITSDHGEELNDRGVYNHGHSHHREVIRVPLVLYGPKYITPSRREQVMRSVDIMPMMAKLARIPLNLGAAGVSSGLTEDPDLLACARTYGSVGSWRNRMSVCRGGWNYIYEQDRDLESLYEWDQDPTELQDLSTAEGEVLTTMRQDLLKASLAREGAHLIVIGSPQPIMASMTTQSDFSDVGWVFASGKQIEIAPREIRAQVSLSRGGACIWFNTEELDSPIAVTVSSSSGELCVTLIDAGDESVGRLGPRGMEGLPEPLLKAFSSWGQEGVQAFLWSHKGRQVDASASSMSPEELKALKSLGYLQ